MTIWARLYEHTDFRGRSAYARLSHGTPAETYGRFTKSWLEATKLHDRVSSLKTNASSWEQGGWFYLFQHENYGGRFSRFFCSPGQETVITSLKPLNMNDRASSCLLVRIFSGQLPAIALGDFGTPSLREKISTRIEADEDLELRGQPIVTWDMWPGFSPSRKYAYIRVPARADVPNWWDYDVELRLWLYLYLDQAGAVRGFIDWFGVWVEGGPFSGKVRDRVMEGLSNALPEINDQIRESLDAVEGLSFERILYLPGRGFDDGHTEDDVSIVLVKEA